MKRDRGRIDKSQQDPDYIKGYVRGVRENGGQYPHAAVWAASRGEGTGDDPLGFFDDPLQV